MLRGPRGRRSEQDRGTRDQGRRAIGRAIARPQAPKPVPWLSRETRRVQSLLVHLAWFVWSACRSPCQSGPSWASSFSGSVNQKDNSCRKHRIAKLALPRSTSSCHTLGPNGLGIQRGAAGMSLASKRSAFQPLNAAVKTQLGGDSPGVSRPSLPSTIAAHMVCCRRNCVPVGHGGSHRSSVGAKFWPVLCRALFGPAIRFGKE